MQRLETNRAIEICFFIFYCWLRCVDEFLRVLVLSGVFAVNLDMKNLRNIAAAGIRRRIAMLISYIFFEMNGYIIIHGLINDLPLN